MSNALPLPFPYVPGQAPVEDRQFQERVQQNFDHLALVLGPANQAAVRSITVAGVSLQWLQYNQSWATGAGSVDVAIPQAFAHNHYLDLICIASGFNPIYFAAAPKDLDEVTVRWNNVSGGAFSATVSILAIGN